MTKYKITCTDLEGDKLKVDIDDGNAEIQNASKFSISVNSEKIKRLIDGIGSIQNLLEDFGFKGLEIEREE